MHGYDFKRGDNGPEVAKIQRLLAAKGFAVKDDGDYGPKTEKAIRAFQKREGLLIDGHAGPQTLVPLGYVSGV